jgi:hypothetical protein
VNARRLAVLLVVAGVLVVAGRAATALLDTPTAATSTRPDGLSTSLGVPEGQDADAHLRNASQRLARAADRQPQVRHPALVTLREPLRPEQAAALLADGRVRLERGYLRADVPGEPEELVFQTPGEVLPALLALFRATATRKGEDQRSLDRAAAAAQDEAAREELQQAADTTGAEAARYAQRCPCVASLLVEGRAADLAGLAQLPVVRGVELAPAGADVEQLEVRPLLATAGEVAR